MAKKPSPKIMILSNPSALSKIAEKVGAEYDKEALERAFKRISPRKRDSSQKRP